MNMPGSAEKSTSGRFAHGNQCIFCLHRTHCLGAQIDRAGRAGQIPDIHFRRRLLKRGQWLYRSGEKLAQISFVCNGALKTCAYNGATEARITDFVLPGESVGLDALFETQARHDAVAIEDSTLCSVPLPALLSALGPSPAVRGALFAHVGATLMRLEWRVGVQQLGAERRIAAFVLQFCVSRATSKSDRLEFRLPMSHGELGNYLGLAAETTSRAFSRLQRRGVLSSRSRLVTVHDVETLRRLGETDATVTDTPPRLCADSA